MSVIPAREQLYAEVWSVPMIHLSKRYGLSGPALRQICVNLAIPIPARGHWAKLAAGHDVPKPPLAAISAGAPARDVEDSTHRREVAKQRAPTRVEPKPPRSTAAHRTAEQIDEVPPSEIHPLIRPLLPLYEKEATEALQRKAKHEWEEANPGRPYRGAAPPYYSWKYFCDRGQVLLPTHKKSAIRASLVTYKRALLVMNSLIAALEKAGYQASFAGRCERLIAQRGEAHISIRVFEKLDPGTRFDRINSVTREKEVVKTLSPTGRLSLGIEQQGLGESVINDTSTATLESKWTEILAAAEFRHRGSLEAVARWRRQREESEQAARLREEAQRLREETQRREAAERERRAALLREAQGWQSAQLLRSYVAHLDSLRIATRNLTDEFDAWRAWALGVAESLDQSNARARGV